MTNSESSAHGWFCRFQCAHSVGFYVCRLVILENQNPGKTMAAHTQRPRSRAHRSVKPGPAYMAADPRAQRDRVSAGAQAGRRLFLWLAILVVCLLLWFVGADWRTLVMVGATAAIFAMAIGQIENMLGR